MKQNEYMERLKAALEERRIADREEILSEYEAHFAFKMADGHAEEEIAARLGEPETVAEQYLPGAAPKASAGQKAVVVTGLVFADIFAGSFFLLLFVWVLVMGAFAAASLSLGVSLAVGLEAAPIIPPMPYGCGLLFAAAFFSLAVLSAAGTIYCAAFFRQLLRAYGRFHGNRMAAASGRAVLPSLSAYPQFAAKARRRLRSVALVSLAVFAVFAGASYTACSLAAGALGFWHVWGWFVT
jgi:uncharacterized membrane protein